MEETTLACWEPLSLTALSGFCVACPAWTLLLNRADCVSTSDEMHSIGFFCAMQDFFLAQRTAPFRVAFLPQFAWPSPGKPHAAMTFENGGLLPKG